MLWPCWRYDLHGLGRMDRILRSTAVEVGVAHAVGVDVASILVTYAIISLALSLSPQSMPLHLNWPVVKETH